MVIVLQGSTQVNFCVLEGTVLQVQVLENPINRKDLNCKSMNWKWPDELGDTQSGYRCWKTHVTCTWTSTGGTCFHFTSLQLDTTSSASGLRTILHPSENTKGKGETGASTDYGRGEEGEPGDTCAHNYTYQSSKIQLESEDRLVLWISFSAYLPQSPHSQHWFPPAAERMCCQAIPHYQSLHTHSAPICTESHRHALLTKTLPSHASVCRTKRWHWGRYVQCHYPIADSVASRLYPSEQLAAHLSCLTHSLKIWRCTQHWNEEDRREWTEMNQDLHRKREK